jgi:DNA polymerase-4
MLKRIACLDLDAFFVEAALLSNPDMRGRPIAVGHDSKRGIICSASYEARKFGVSSAMPIYMAKNRCPDIKILPIPENISQLSNSIRKLLTELCPVVEQASVDEFYLDFTGCDRIYPHNLSIANKIVDTIRQNSGLPSTIGFGTSKIIAKIASNLGKPKGILDVLPGHESSFLADIPVKQIPGIGEKLESILHSMGVCITRDILLIPREAWKAAFGKTGDFIFNTARGICSGEVIPDEKKPLRKGISCDTTLEENSCSRLFLVSRLSQLVEKAVYRLNNENLSCGRIGVKIKYSDFVTRTTQASINRTNLETDIFPITVKLFNRLFNRRVAIRMIGVQLGAIQTGGITPSLWNSILPEYKKNLPEVIKIIRAKFGFSAILRSRSLSSVKRQKQ